MFWHLTPLRKAKKLTTWIATWVMLSLLCQTIIPTVAYARSDLNPGLWNEICSAYGSRQVSSDNSAPGDSGSSHHADCPLCLNIFNDIIPGNSVLVPEFYLLLVNEIGNDVYFNHHFTYRATVPEARGPPIFN